MNIPETQKKQLSWSRDNWRNFSIKQQPSYKNQTLLLTIAKKLSTLPRLVTIQEIEQLKSQLKLVSGRQAFILQGGDCAESFSEFSEENLQNFFQLMQKMSKMISLQLGCKVIRIGRIAGQFAKPRSSQIETKLGVSLPNYKGDMVNSVEFDAVARESDPNRLLQAYYQSAATINYLRGLEQSVDQKLFTSHEALILNFEEQFTRYDHISDKWYNISTHIPWIGNNTNAINSAHTEYAKGLANPLGIKIGIDMNEDDLVDLTSELNPLNEDGRLTLIIRMGAERIEQYLPALILKLQEAKKNVIWSCDPMHGNTTFLTNGYKTRDFNQISLEMEKFFAIHKQLGSYAGGIHLEMCGQDVTECLGGKQKISEANLKERYFTHCDPRLNYSQSIELIDKLLQGISKHSTSMN